MLLNPAELAMGFCFAPEKRKNVKGIQSTGINQLLEEYQPEPPIVFKIDIKGEEQNLFQSDVKWLQKINLILVEAHSKKIADNIRRVLSLHEFNIYQVGEKILGHRKK